MKIINTAICLLAACFVMAARGATLTWTGSAGDSLWANYRNWSGATSTTDFTAAHDYVFVDLADGTVIRVNNARNANPVIMNSLTMTSSSTNRTWYFKSNNSSFSRLQFVSNAVFRISAGCTLDNSVPAYKLTSYSIDGGGSYRMLSTMESGEGCIVVTNATFINAYECREIRTAIGRMGMQLATDTARFLLEENTFVKLVNNPLGTLPTIDLGGYRLVNDLSAGDGYSGELIGDSEASFYVIQPRSFTFLTNPSLTGTYGVYNSRMEFGTENSLVMAEPDSIFDIYGSGIIELHCDQSLSLLKGTGATGQLRIPARSTVTLYGMEGDEMSSTFNGRFVGGGNIIKYGTNYEFIVTGDSASYSGKVTVAEGTLTLQRTPLEAEVEDNGEEGDDDDGERVEPPQTSSVPELPSPSAHWSFDEDFNDSVGGIKMTDGNSGAKASLVEMDGAIGKCLELKSNGTKPQCYLKLASGSSLTNMPVGNQPFSVSIRQRCNNALSFTRSFSFGDLTTAGQYVACGTAGDTCYPFLVWSRAKNSNGSDVAFEDFPNDAGPKDSLGWDNIMVTYDGANMSCYIDGIPCKTQAVALTILRNSVYFGYHQYHPSYTTKKQEWRYWKGYIDDVRVWNDCCLSASQVRDVARMISKTETSTAGVFEKAEIVVETNTLLKVEGLGNAAKCIAGCGTLWVNRDSAMKVGAFGDGFTGTIRGAGLLEYSGDSDLSLTDASRFYGLLRIDSGVTKLNSSYSDCKVQIAAGEVSGGVAPVEIMEEAVLLVNGDDPDTPIIQTSGELKLPEVATVDLTGSKPDRDVLIAEGSSVVAPADFSKWTIPITKGRFKMHVRGNRLYLAFRHGAAVIYF